MTGPLIIIGILALVIVVILTAWRYYLDVTGKDTTTCDFTAVAFGVLALAASLGMWITNGHWL